jgi:hypothetical protein
MVVRFARTLALLALAAPPAFAQTKPPQPPPDFVCTGAITQSAGMNWDSSRIEFTFPYGLNQQSTTLASGNALLNQAPLLLELGNDALTGRESKARLGAGDRGFAITELRISRATGRFTMVAVVLRNLEVVEGRTAWEGECRRQGAAERKF